MKERRTWPFKDMKVGDQIEIYDQEDFGPCQAYVHAYARGRGKKFKTQLVTSDSSKVMVVIRTK